MLFWLRKVPSIKYVDDDPEANVCMTTCGNLLGAVAWSIYCSSLGNWIRVGHFGQMLLWGCLVLAKFYNCQVIVMIFLWCLLAKITPICDFWSYNYGGIRYCEITAIARLHFTPYSGLKWRLLFVICHRTLFFFCLGVKFLLFFHLLLLKSIIFSLHLSNAFYFFQLSLFLLFWSCQVPDLGLPFTPNLLRSMFAYHLFLICHCSLEITQNLVQGVTAGLSQTRLR